ncbi:RIM15, signal transduction response regulator [Hysterangium stoloniferum]|nr:RIM15, signal transduction response regulator [Hysterangium stoloniferum]
MSDSSSPPTAAGVARRGAPSPLIFNPDTVLPVSLSSNTTTARGQPVNMPHVKRNITRRLKLAKQDCDATLRKITNNITEFMEEQIRNKQFEDSQQQYLREPLEFQPAELSSAVAFLDQPPDDTASDDAGYDAEPEGRHSRQLSISSSPASLRRLSNLPPVSTNTSTDTSPRKTPSFASANMPPPSWSSQPATHLSRRLSRSVHIPVQSAPASRSASRSRSPLPSHTPPTNFASELHAPTISDRRRSRAFLDDPPAPDPFLISLHELTAIATDICEISVSTLTSQPKFCHDLVAKVRSIGNAWDEHPDWPGRSWHMQVLLALASLTRVVEWWEAENKFWNFNEESDAGDVKDGEDEPFVFVFKPENDGSDSFRTPLAITEHHQHKGQDNKALMVRDEYRSRFSPSRPSRLSGRRSRDEMQKDITTILDLQEDQDRTSAIQTEASRVKATEALRESADFARYTNIVLELGSNGDHVLSVNPAWRTVVGSDPDELLDHGLSRWLHPGNWNIFKDACRDLQADSSNTKEIRFKLLVEPDTDSDGEKLDDYSGVFYCEMEGKGMLVSEKASASRTMWVLKTLSPPHMEDAPGVELEAREVGDDPASFELLRFFDLHRPPKFEPIMPFPLQRPISTVLILCRICECQVPEWYFEKHNESCNDVHRFEADIADCNETIAELRSTVRELSAALDRVSPLAVPDYRGMPVLYPNASPNIPSPQQQSRAPLFRMQRAGVRKMQQRVLEQLDDILSLASEISVPALKEEESTEPIERQSLLSPSSVSKVELVRNWNKPTTEDPALSRLIQDVEKVMFAKVDNVLRMQERIRYSELSRRVWEASVEEQLAKLDEEDEEDEQNLSDDGLRSNNQQGTETADTNSGDSHSSTRSEYAFGRDVEPRPIAPFSSSIPNTSVREPLPQAAFQGFGSAFGTRSSTPSSVSSPLALAVPITAAPPSLALSPEIEQSLRTIRSPRSTQALRVEHRLTLTPPLSPMVTSRESGAHLRRHSTVHTMSPISTSGPLSPRIPSLAPLSRTTPPSLKDFEIIKPISKGAFGSVFLAKKKTTGDYYAIKVLKKADMIAKNQITNVKHERMILMKQSESPFVAKLYFTFQSKDYLYLVMEYLNGGDCAALIKSLGSLPEEWTRNYIAEVILGLEYLHKRGVVHRDLKPDNLLIDQHGHLKLTDFGLSRIGLLGRQTRDNQYLAERANATRSLARYSPSRPPSIDSGSPLVSAQIGTDSYFNTRVNSHSAPHMAGNFQIPGPPLSDDVSESSGSESLSGLFWKRGRPGESPLQSFATDLTNDLRSHSGGLGTPPMDQKFVGTPDYLAPESILGISGDDPAVDWWALGVITYEFLYGIPPFHAESPEKVFANILSGHIEWHEDWVEYSEDARNFMVKLMATDPSKRLGAKGADEVKAHPFFAGVEWDKVTTQEAQFIPQVTDPESTDYFDSRGALPHLFQEDEELSVRPVLSESPGSEYLATPPIPVPNKDTAASPADDFGAFSYKNLPILKQANDDVIRKLKTESKPEPKSLPIPLPSPSVLGLDAPSINRRRSVSQRIKKSPTVVTSLDKNVTLIPGPPSPSTSASSIASSPSRASHMPAASVSNAGAHLRRPSEYGALERFKASQLEGDARRNSMPSRLRTASVSSTDHVSSDSSDMWPSRIPGHLEIGTSASSLSWSDRRPHDAANDRAVTCLVAEDNPISQKILETVLTRMGCRCVLAADGAEAISIALGDTKFDCILMDLHMPVVDGEQAARYIKSTSNKNTSTPIIAVSAYSGQDASAASNIFAASLAKPITKSELLVVMRQLGFKTTAQDGAKATTKLAR